MFNAKNELDQSRFVGDLSESIAEMEEMETIKKHNLIETIHFRQQERLRRHRMSHAISENAEDKSRAGKVTNMIENCDTSREQSDLAVISSQAKEARLCDGLTAPTKRKESDEIPIPRTNNQQEPKLRSEFRSMLNLSSSGDYESRTQAKGLRPNHSFLQHHQPDQAPQPRGPDHQPGSHNDSGSSGQRRCSTGSVHSLDSGLFLSRDISPNQSG